jgi:hypothetical protein
MPNNNNNNGPKNKYIHFSPNHHNVKACGCVEFKCYVFFIWTVLQTH